MKKTLLFILGLGLILSMATSVNAQCHPFRKPPQDTTVQKCKAEFCFSRANDTMVTIRNNSKAGNYFEWLLPDGTKKKVKNLPSFALPRGASYTLCLVAGDSTKNCYDTLCKTIKIPLKPCQAGFKVALDTTLKNKLFLINTSSKVPGHTYFYSWSFGDGNSSADRNPKHRYASFGKYEICLFMIDSNQNCASMYCDSLGLDSNGKLLKAQGFYLEVIPEATTTILETNKEKPIIYPNPTNGFINVALANYTGGEMKVKVRNTQGVLVESMSLQASQIQLDMSNHSNGVYIVNIVNDDQSWVYRFIKSDQGQ